MIYLNEMKMKLTSNYYDKPEWDKKKLISNYYDKPEYLHQLRMLKLLKQDVG